MQAQRVAHHLRHDDVALELLDAEEEQHHPHRRQRVLHERVDHGGAAPSHGPMYGINSVMPAHTPKINAYLPPFGIRPVMPRIQRPTPELAPMMSDNASWPFT